MSSERIFITGATGLAGSHILRYLMLKGYRNIVAMRRESSRMDLVEDLADDIAWAVGSLDDVDVLHDAMTGADWVIHAAALISYEKNSEQAMYRVNVDGTANVVNAALANDVSKFLHISSVSTYARTGGDQIISEKTEWQFTPYTTIYGHTKHLAEMEVWRGQAEGLDTVMINPSIILGSGHWGDGSLKIVQRLGEGLKYYPTGAIGYVDVRDVARLALLRLQGHGSSGRMLTSGHDISYKKFFDKLAPLLGVPAPSIRISPWLSEIAWRALLPLKWITGRENTISKHTARTTSCNIGYDNSLSLSIDGFNYTDLQTTLEDVAKKYRQSRDAGWKALPMEFSEE